ncbi:Transcriptional activator [Tulasnella sp. 331]|nr:Transcriptional activator [Tulasnella sp. 331]
MSDEYMFQPNLYYSAYPQQQEAPPYQQHNHHPYSNPNPSHPHPHPHPHHHQQQQSTQHYNYDHSRLYSSQHQQHLQQSPIVGSSSRVAGSAPRAGQYHNAHPDYAPHSPENYTSQYSQDDGLQSIAEGGNGAIDHGEGGVGEDGIDEEPLFVNAKQYHRILKRRIARQRLEEIHKLSRDRKASSLSQRHQALVIDHATNLRGRFLTQAEIAEMGGLDAVVAAQAARLQNQSQGKDPVNPDDPASPISPVSSTSKGKKRKASDASSPQSTTVTKQPKWEDQSQSQSQSQSTVVYSTESSFPLDLEADGLTYGGDAGVSYTLEPSVSADSVNVLG